MPIGKIIGAVVKGKKAYDAQGMKDPEIPVPGRPRSEGPMLTQPSSKANANLAADMLKVPGRNVVRGAMAKRKQMLDEI
jgi:hypothetical protein